MSSRIKVVLGTMTFGNSSASSARVTDKDEVQKLLKVFQSYGHNELDTARVYCDGTTEEYLGGLEPQIKHKFKVRTTITALLIHN